MKFILHLAAVSTVHVILHILAEHSSKAELCCLWQKQRHKQTNKKTNVKYEAFWELYF